MAKKYYAVKDGYIPGIYKSWDECKKQVEGFSGATYKGFETLDEAESYLGHSKESNEILVKDNLEPISKAVAYVDGSYEHSRKEFSYGLVMFTNGIEKRFAEKYNTINLVDMRNVAGEIMGAQKAMQYCIDNDIKNLDLYYDYEGIAKWCTGEWKANKLGTQNYKDYYDSIKELLKVNFYKVVAHTGDTYNEVADQLAKGALNGNVIAGNITSKEDLTEMGLSKSIYIERNCIDQLISEVGSAEWPDFNAQVLCKVGNQERCSFFANGKNATLDFYFKTDGATTIRATGVNTELSTKLAELLEAYGYKNDHRNSSCAFNSVNESNYLKLIGYLKSIDRIKVVEESRVESPAHNHYKFRSSFGDCMVINRYDTGKLLFQGNPAYLFTEALYFMSLSPDISLNEIIDRKNETYKSSITVNGARLELRQRIPNIYDKLDDTILKLLSPSIALSTSNIVVEDYSCYVFPAFKALEALLLDLLSTKSIFVNSSNNFGSVFAKDTVSPKHVLTNENRIKVNDSGYSQCVEDIYNYFKGSRHVVFHANQVLALTTIISDKREAGATLNNILTYFDDVGLRNIK